MKTLLYFFSILFVFAFIPTKAQNYLTNGQVYNYDIGDVIQTRYYKAASNTYTYVTKTVLNKTYSINNDSIFYRINLDSFTALASSCSTCSTVFTSTTAIEINTNLNDSAITHNNETGCTGIQNSFYQDYCNKIVWKQSPAMMVGCGPQIQQSTYLIEGLGGPYHEYIQHPFGLSTVYWEIKLIYYSKQSGACGILATLINEKFFDKIHLSIYPNPTNNILDINTSSDFTIIETTVFDITGKTILSNKNQNTIDVSKLNSGIYFVKVKTDKGEVKQKFIKE